MTTWMVEALSAEDRCSAELAVGDALLADLTGRPASKPASYGFVAQTYELAVSTLLGDADSQSDLREVADLAFETSRACTERQLNDEAIVRVLHTACYGVLADRTPDVARYLRDLDLPPRLSEDSPWGGRVRRSVSRTWMLLLRKRGWEDLDAVQDEVISLRQAQAAAEQDYLASEKLQRTAAWELMASYHLARSAEILATYSAQGEVGGHFDIRAQLQAQFDRSITACERAELIDLHATVQLLAAAAERMVANSIWTVTRAVNGRVSKFVSHLTDRSRQRPIFEMLPPQRITLRENGLLGSSHRAVVVSLPTSAGKTFVAQFRILQALNQFEAERGWIAYIAPTRTLVNQICGRLRRDFAALGVTVERVSPALEIDGVEAELLAEQDEKLAFRVLVSTPEKLDLLLRGGWEAKIGRPLTLVVVDEAHNLSSAERGLKLELLLATINREAKYSQFLLLTPFIRNGSEVARWLSPDSHSDLSIAFDWRPNDRAIAIAKPLAGHARGTFSIQLDTVHTSKSTISVSKEITLCEGRSLGLTWAKVKGNQSNVAAATASCLNRRGPVIVLAGKVPHTWAIARTLANDPEIGKRLETDKRDKENISFVADFIAQEFGSDFELVGLLEKRIGVHHSSLSEEARVLLEWLTESGELDSLVATTTIAQGVNFPVSGVVVASHQYPYGQDMTPEDFWNLAGRAGRADQVGTGIIALAATNDERASKLRDFVNRQVVDLNSTLVDMVQKVLVQGQTLELHALYWMKEWSAFLQYLAHSYRQTGNHAEFANQVEQVLRGSFGFQKLRAQNFEAANSLVSAVHNYADILRGKPLSLVDATGFSWESVSRALAGVGDVGIKADAWDPTTLFSPQNTTLERAFGVLFTIPELREDLVAVTGGQRGDGKLLARIVKDWVAGASIPDLADNYFKEDGASPTARITKACRAVYGKLTMTASWGLSALQTITTPSSGAGLSGEALKTFQNLPSRVYYGVNSDAAIDLRVLGVPRNAAEPVAALLRQRGVGSRVENLRYSLRSLDASAWVEAMGSRGNTYMRAWKVLEGID